jgi:hypothetical protein
MKETRCAAASRHSSAASVESTYSQTGSRGTRDTGRARGPHPSTRARPASHGPPDRSCRSSTGRRAPRRARTRSATAPP